MSNLHLLSHFIIPLLIVALFFRKNWQTSYFIMISAMLIDLDHLLATPIYDPLRCSIGFHPLHGFLAITFYCGLYLFPKSRLFGIGLLIHILLDSLDCQRTNGIWFS